MSNAIAGHKKTDLQDAAPQQTFFKLALPDATAREAYAQSHPALARALQTRSSHDPALAEKITKTFMMFHYFKDGGLSGIRVSAEGTSLEEYLSSVLMAHKADFVKGAMFHQNLDEKAAGHVEKALKESPEFKTRFVLQARSQAMSPFMAYVMIGGLLLANDAVEKATLQMDGTHQLLLKLELEGTSPLVINLLTGDGFDVPAASLEKATAEAVEKYRIYKMHDKAIPKIIGSDKLITHAMPTVAKLGEQLLTTETAARYRESIANRASMTGPEFSPSRRNAPAGFLRPPASQRLPLRLLARAA